MPFIQTTYDNIMNYFYGNDNEQTNDKPEIPYKLEGIWNLESIGNMSMLMTLNNGDFDLEKRRITVKLYKPGNWLFKEENFFTKFLCKFIKYSYQFDFNEDYSKADIYIKLGKVPIYLSKSIMDWQLRVKSDKMLRYTSIFGNAHFYESKRLDNDDLVKIKNNGYEKLYYC